MKNNLVVGERLHELRLELRDLAETATAHFCRLGEIMKEIRDNELWQGQYESFEAFFSDPEFSFKRSSVYHAIRLVEVFPKWQELKDVPVSKPIMVVPHLNEQNRDELVGQARTLSTSDLYTQLSLLNTMQGLTDRPSLPKVYPCSTCGKAKGISWKDLCHCGYTIKQVKIISEVIDKIERTI